MQTKTDEKIYIRTKIDDLILIYLLNRDSFDVAAERILLLRCGKKRMRNERKLVHLLLWSN